MAISTYNARIDIARYYANKATTTYFAIGKSSAWSDEMTPPTPSAKTTKLDEVIGYKKATRVSLCRPLVQGESTSYEQVTYGDTTWVLVPDSKAFSEGAKWVYFETDINGDELPLGFYRQVGVHTNLVPSVSKSNLLPSEVKDSGTLIFYDNRQPQNRMAQSSVKERYIMEL